MIFNNCITIGIQSLQSIVTHLSKFPLSPAPPPSSSATYMFSTSIQIEVFEILYELNKFVILVQNISYYEASFWTLNVL